MQIAVPGSGNGGCATAFDWANHGYTVSLFDFESFPQTIAAVNTHGGIYAEGQLQGFAPIAYAGHDIAQALDGADLIFAVGPAFSTRPFAVACKPHIKPGQTVIVCPSSCGGAMSLRMQLPAMGVATNVMQTMLQNGNPIIHPAITLLNTAVIEGKGSQVLFYEEGVTPSVGRVIKAVDDERIAIGHAFGVNILSDPDIGITQGYMTTATYDDGYSKSPGFRGIKAQSSLDNRYFHEDVGYSLVFIKDLALKVGVKTPVIDAIITLVSKVMDRDYGAEAPRTMASLGLESKTISELRKL
ncbi:6-phosphogluconate dehydrogenase [Gracilaria domingensis]|nr:6-phosphogluconate dehydrogenase [Gracilaria domingensis]